MIRLYQGSGASDIELLGGNKPREEWADVRDGVVSLLRARGCQRAAKLFGSFRFELHDATNHFNDEFVILYLHASVAVYTELAGQAEGQLDRSAYQQIAETMGELGTHVRFIACGLDIATGPQPVPSPSLVITSDTVECALADCEQLISSRGATSGVDRVHTAFHGYLKAVCDRGGISAPQDAAVTQLFKLIREQHAAFTVLGPRSTEVTKVARGMANVIDALSPLRNQATLAHPNDAVLEEAEAMLVINAVRTLLHYLDSKLTTTP